MSESESEVVPKLSERRSSTISGKQPVQGSKSRSNSIKPEDVIKPAETPARPPTDKVEKQKQTESNEAILDTKPKRQAADQKEDGPVYRVVK